MAGKKKKTAKKTAKKKAAKKKVARTSSRPSSSIPLPSTTTLPIVLHSMSTESRARTIFHAAVDPWMTTGWTQHDYGIDAMVEIRVDRAGGPDGYASGKRFAVQLKGTEQAIKGDKFAVDVSPGQIGYWLENTEYVMFAVVHVPDRQVYWRWIDDELVSELSARSPSWFGQQTVSIPVSTSKKLDAAGLREVEKAVFGQRRTARRVFRPGDYFRLHQEATAISKSLIEQAQRAGIESVKQRLVDTQVALRNCTYVIAIAGPSRVGKSTLLNALLRRNVSPIGRFPTTAVALMALAAEKDQTEIEFHDGKRVTGPATAEFIADYAHQDNNPRNRKAVRLVCVRLVSEPLERGIALVDAPGLHDASPEIRAQTKETLHRADAFVYVLSCAGMRAGEFELSAHFVDDLQWLRSIARRLLIVINKVDMITDDQQRDLMTYLEPALKEYGLWDELPKPPLFVSADSAWKEVKSGSEPESLRELETLLWEHLLESRSTGVDRLASLLTQLDSATAEFMSLVAVRRATAEQVTELREAVAACRAKRAKILAECRERLPKLRVAARELVATRRDFFLASERKRLEHVELDHNLPSIDALKKDVAERLTVDMAECWSEIRAQLKGFANYISAQVESSLKQARMTTGIPAIRLAVPAIELPDDFGPDAFGEPVIGAIVLGILGLALSPVAAVIGAFLGAVLGAETSKGSRRKRDIESRMKSLDPKVRDAFDGLSKVVNDRVRLFSANLVQHVSDRMDVYLHDVERQIAALGSESAIDPAVEKDLQETRGRLARLVRDIGAQ